MELNATHPENRTGNESGFSVPDRGPAFIEETIANWIWIICPPIIFFFGVTGNILAALVLSRRAFSKGTMSIYLTALALVDTGVLSVGLGRYWIRSVFDVEIRDLSDLSCKMHVFSTYFLLQLSSCILLTFTTERALSIIRPHDGKYTRKNSAISLFVIGVFLSLINGHIIYGFRLDTKGICTWELLPDYSFFFLWIYPWIDLTFASILPSIVLIISNVIIVREMRRSDSKLAGPSSVVSVSNRNSRKTSGQIVKILVALFVVFFVTTTPWLVVIIVIDAHLDGVPPSTTTTRLVAGLELSYNASAILAHCNNALNFYLYCLSGSKFRRQLLEMFKCSSVQDSRNPISTAVKTCESTKEANINN